MKRLLLALAVFVAACGPVYTNTVSYDPCQPANFNPPACQAAMSQGGYNYNGTWYPVQYSQPYTYYYNGYSSYIGSGHHTHVYVYTAPSTVIHGRRPIYPQRTYAPSPATATRAPIMPQRTYTAPSPSRSIMPRRSFSSPSFSRRPVFSRRH